MYCSKGIDRLSETYQICFPFAFDASNGWPGGAHFGGCSYCDTSFFASAIPAAGASRLEALDDAEAPSAATTAPATASAVSRIRQPFSPLLIPIISPPFVHRVSRLPASRENATASTSDPP